MWDRTPNSAALAKASTPITWRQIEAALVAYFDGERNRNGNTGDIWTKVDNEYEVYEPCDLCDECPANDTLVDINLTALARFLAREVGATHDAHRPTRQSGR